MTMIAPRCMGVAPLGSRGAAGALRTPTSDHKTVRNHLDVLHVHVLCVTDSFIYMHKFARAKPWLGMYSHNQVSSQFCKHASTVSEGKRGGAVDIGREPIFYASAGLSSN